MKKLLCVLVTASLLVGMTSVGGFADTREECITLCKQAGEMIQTEGIEAAIEEIGNRNGRFVWKVNYVFLMDMNAKMLAHPIKPELCQKDTLIDMTDVAGKPFFVDFIKVAKQGRGWVNYMWPIPGEIKATPKSTFIYRVPDTPYFVGAGFYNMGGGVYH